MKSEVEFLYIFLLSPRSILLADNDFYMSSDGIQYNTIDRLRFYLTSDFVFCRDVYNTSDIRKLLEKLK